MSSPSTPATHTSSSSLAPGPLLSAPGPLLSAPGCPSSYGGRWDQVQGQTVQGQTVLGLVQGQTVLGLFQGQTPLGLCRVMEPLWVLLGLCLTRRGSAEYRSAGDWEGGVQLRRAVPALLVHCVVHCVVHSVVHCVFHSVTQSE